MNVPTIKGIIDRRILINFIADPDVIQKLLPAVFKPKIYKDKAIVGICLIRLKQIRPKGFPGFIGISSENAAHRIAVQWTEGGATKEGVFIPRRDTSSSLNTFAGGRIFPGKHFPAKFNVQEAEGNYHIDFKSSDNTSIAIDAKDSNLFSPDSVFENISNASRFFEAGELGFSPNADRYDGLKLKTFDWKVTALQVQFVHSSFFEDETIFPKGSVQFDNALLMKEIKHEWHSVKQII
ncbi:MAG TPA: DUF2071 domain-containing protein [Chitinophagaceae bacterium]|nr:DUF2071 domain-containing protein [Chitinophagaceae bacterium]